MDYFFAGIFGFNSGEVGADAVAEWGVVAGGLGVPITVDLQQLHELWDHARPAVARRGRRLPARVPEGHAAGTRAGASWTSRSGETGTRRPAPSRRASRPTSSTTAAPSTRCRRPRTTASTTGCRTRCGSRWRGSSCSSPCWTWTCPRARSSRTAAPLGGTDCTGAEIDSLRAQGYDCQIDTAYIVGWIQLFVEDVSKHGPDITVTVDYRGITTGGGIPGDGHLRLWGPGRSPRRLARKRAQAANALGR